jgi:hypothetical protein
MWNSAKVLDISCFWLRKRSGTIGTTGTLERLEPAVAWKVLNGAVEQLEQLQGTDPVLNGAQRINVETASGCVRASISKPKSYG